MRRSCPERERFRTCSPQPHGYTTIAGVQIPRVPRIVRINYVYVFHITKGRQGNTMKDTEVINLIEQLPQPTQHISSYPLKLSGLPLSLRGHEGHLKGRLEKTTSAGCCTKVGTRLLTRR